MLTPLFFKDANEVCQKRKVLLSFDNFEAASSELVAWILRLREYKPSQGVRIAIAGRDLPGAKWDALRRITLIIRLDVFTEREAEAFLDAFGVTDYDRRREILEYSGRLPVLMSWLSAPEGQEFDHTVPTHDIVERFLRWVPELRLRQVALLAAIPHTFNIDILKLLMNFSESNTDIQPLFDWLLTMPFVQQRSEGWQYHSVVRRLMLRYQRQKSPSTYRHMHSILANFFDIKREEISPLTKNEWNNEEWRANTLTYAYHFLVSDHIQHWHEVINLFSIALRKRRSFAFEIIELLSSDHVHDELSHEQNNLVQTFKQQLQAVEDGSLKDGFEMFDKLCHIPDLSASAKCYTLAYRGETYRQMEHYAEALADFDRAIALNEKYGWAIAQRGETYRLLGPEYYQEALADFTRAIALDEKDAEAIASRGQVYRALERYEEALSDFTRAIALDENLAWVFGERGDIYWLMGKYQEALADFDSVLGLSKNSAWARVGRGRIYRVMIQYTNSLTEFNQAIDLDKEYSWAFAGRGETYRLMRRYEDALADFNTAITLDENLDWAIAQRGETYLLQGRYEEALADFNRAIALDERYASYRYYQALVYLATNKQRDFEKVLGTAIELAQTALPSEPNSLSASFDLALCKLVSGDIYAETEYERIIETCQSFPHLQIAINDLYDFLVLQPANQLARRIHLKLQTHASKLSGSSIDDSLYLS